MARNVFFVLSVLRIVQRMHYKLLPLRCRQKIFKLILQSGKYVIRLLCEMKWIKIYILIVLLVCSTFIYACGKADTESIEDRKDTKTENDEEAKSDTEYWLCGTGISDGPDYTGGICKMYFKQNAVVLEGNLLKSMSQKDYGEQIGTVETYVGEEIEVSEDCVIIEDEGNEDKSYAYEEYIESREISETDNVAGIYTAITIRSGKVIEIYYSS